MARSRETLNDLLAIRKIGTTELAAKAGVSPRSLLHWRQGVHKPRSAELGRLAEALRMPVDRVRAAVVASGQSLTLARR